MNVRIKLDWRVSALTACLFAGLLFAGQMDATAQGLKPKMAGALPLLSGTAWKIDFGKGVTGTAFLFCKKSGRWEIVPARARSIGAVGKSYGVSGNTLTTVNADDGMVEKWKMNWKAEVLELFDGKATLRLHYHGEAQC